jgi:hypothetical protein
LIYLSENVRFASLQPWSYPAWKGVPFAIASLEKLSVLLLIMLPLAFGVEVKGIRLARDGG